MVGAEQHGPSELYAADQAVPDAQVKTLEDMAMAGK